ncbi:hypothetical protein FJY94_03185 [Candidatus Kaiserbacteria bacterium]|nr:hypothetical protein [Candidatus Kaiserbacteria bacterium]
MIDSHSLLRLHAAATKIEVDGIEAIRTVTTMVGEEVAVALLIAHLRRSLGSTQKYPPDPTIRTRVDTLLRTEGLIE